MSPKSVRFASIPTEKFRGSIGRAFVFQGPTVQKLTEAVEWFHHAESFSGSRRSGNKVTIKKGPGTECPTLQSAKWSSQGLVSTTAVATAATTATTVTAATTASAAATTAWCARTGFVHGHIASGDCGAIKILNCILCILTIRHFDKREAAGSAGFPIHDDVDRRNLSKLFESRTYVIVGGGKREVTYIDIRHKTNPTNGHQ